MHRTVEMTALLCAILFLGGLASALTQPFLGVFAIEHIGLSLEAFGWAAGGTAAISVVLAISIGKWTDQHGRHRQLYFVTQVAGAIGFGMCAMLASPAAYMAASLVALALFATTPSQALAWTKVAMSDNEAPSTHAAQGYVRAAYSLAWALGPALGGMLVASRSYTAPFVAATAVCVLSAALCLAARPVPPPAAHERALASRRSRSGALHCLSMALALFSLCSNAALLMVPIHIVKSLQHPPSLVGYLFAAAAALEVLLMVALSRSSFARRHALTVVSSGIASFAAYCLLIATASDLVGFLIAQVFNAVAVSAVMVMGLQALQAFLPGEAGRAAGIFGASLTGGATLAGPFFSFLTSSATTAQFLQAIAVLSTGASLLAVLAAAWSSRQRSALPARQRHQPGAKQMVRPGR